MRPSARASLIERLASPFFSELATTAELEREFKRSRFQQQRYAERGSSNHPRFAGHGCVPFSLPPVVGATSVEELLISAKCDFMQVIDAPRQIRTELFCVSMTRQS